MSAIGILGGMGPQASARLVELLIAQTPQFVSNPIDSDFPEIILMSVPVPNFISNKNNLGKAKTILQERTKLLEQSGSTINCISCNTAHLLLSDLEKVTNVPFVSIPQLVAEKIKANGFTRVGLLATPTTLRSTLFDKVIGKNVTLVRPSHDLATQTETLIVKQLSGHIGEREREHFRAQVDEFLQANHLDAVILGCTELPLVFGDTTDKQVIDTLEVLSEGLLMRFFNQ